LRQLGPVSPINIPLLSCHLRNEFALDISSDACDDKTRCYVKHVVVGRRESHCEWAPGTASQEPTCSMWASMSANLVQMQRHWISDESYIEDWVRPSSDTDPHTRTKHRQASSVGLHRCEAK
jgi:hypothetical protein